MPTIPKRPDERLIPLAESRVHAGTVDCPSQRESQNDPHAVKSALGVLASLFRKKGLDILTVDFGDFPIPKFRKNLSA